LLVGLVIVTVTGLALAYSFVWLFRVYCERRFTTETPSTQSSEYFLMNIFALRPPRLGGEISEIVLHHRVIHVPMGTTQRRPQRLGGEPHESQKNQNSCWFAFQADLQSSKSFTSSEYATTSGRCPLASNVSKPTRPAVWPPRCNP
jgi:hypothetical protein